MERKRDTTCFFTGHRTVPEDRLASVVEQLNVTIRRLAGRGYTDFICGGALGFDTIAACRVAAAHMKDPKIRLVLMLPCRDQTNLWTRTSDIALYGKLKGLASEVIYAADFYSDGVMLLRDRMMADAGSLCVAYYDGRQGGGTAYTLRYAEQRGVTVVNLYEE